MLFYFFHFFFFPVLSVFFFKLNACALCVYSDLNTYFFPSTSSDTNTHLEYTIYIHCPKRAKRKRKQKYNVVIHPQEWVYNVYSWNIIKFIYWNSKSTNMINCCLPNKYIHVCVCARRQVCMYILCMFPNSKNAAIQQVLVFIALSRHRFHTLSLSSMPM